MKTRDIKELLILLRDSLESKMVGDNKGMCPVVHEMRHDGIITVDEADALLKYISGHKPLNAKRRALKYSMYETDDDGYFLALFWWTLGALKPRIAWLNEQIAKL